MYLLITQMLLEHRLSALFNINGLGKVNYKTRQETFTFYKLVRVVLEICRYIMLTQHRISSYSCKSLMNKDAFHATCDSITQNDSSHTYARARIC